MGFLNIFPVKAREEFIAHVKANYTGSIKELSTSYGCFNVRLDMQSEAY